MIESVQADIVKVNDSGRDVIEAIKLKDYTCILFTMYRGKSYYKLIWKML